VSWVAHYLDDFITVGSPESPECQTNLKIMQTTCQWLGVPVVQKKCAGRLITVHLAPIIFRSTCTGGAQPPVARACAPVCPSLATPLLVSAVRKALVEAGLTREDYTGHSFRIGAASTVAACGHDHDSGALEKSGVPTVRFSFRGNG